MEITSHHVSGFVIGVGTATAAYYFYKKNQSQVDEFLRRQGIQLPDSGVKEYNSMNLQELVTEKEHLEDLIAERELAEKVPENKK